MVTISLQGGIANQLFQKFALVAFALRNNLEYALPKHSENTHRKEPYIFGGLIYSDNIPELPVYTEPSFHYHPIPYMDNVCLSGYFQSELYFRDYFEEIIDMLEFPYREQKGVCSIHIRRGDFLLKPDYHPFVGEDYLRTAMATIKEKTGVSKFNVFSDEMGWCKEFFTPQIEYDFEFIEGNNEVQDLIQGSWCEHQIMSNSAFSIWQFLLNKNKEKICIAPKKWFGIEAAHNTRDVYPLKNCIKL